jgi:iron complex outermembrane receptor protein
MLCACVVHGSERKEEIFDVTRIPLEQLLETEFIPASRIARQISDAPSAVSIVTAQDIRDYGYRTLSDILKSMRGLYVTSSFDYDYLGGRGFGSPGDYAGRIMLTIDDYPTNENFYNQIFLSEDSLLDVEVIERVEFIPGPGSTTYGNSAFLGVINIVTKKGRDFDGTQLAVGFGSNDERSNRLTYGKRYESGLEFLLSASIYRDDGISVEFPALDGWMPFSGDSYSNQAISPLKKTKNRRLFLKGMYAGWSLEFATVRRNLINSAFLSELEPSDLGLVSGSVDENSFVSINFDSDLMEKLKSSTRLYSGRYLYQYDIEGEFPYNVESTSRWWGVDFKFVGSWFDKHKILFGAEYREDYRQRYELESYYYSDLVYRDVYDTDTHTVSYYVQDAYSPIDILSLTFGLRYDDNSASENYSSPRVAVNYTPWSSSTFKLSYGKAFRYANPWERYWSNSTDIEPEKVRTAELVWQQQFTSKSRLTASLYRNRVSDAVLQSYSELETIGQEVGIEYVSESGFRFSASIAHQNTEDGRGEWLMNSPRWISKLNIAQPIFQHRAMVGFEMQNIGRRLDVYGKTVQSNTLANLTLSSERLIPNLFISLNIQNLFDAPQESVLNNYILRTLPADGRSVWLKLEYNIK